MASPRCSRRLIALHQTLILQVLLMSAKRYSEELKIEAVTQATERGYKVAILMHCAWSSIRYDVMRTHITLRIMYIMLNAV